ncbi:hypothetical protein ABIA39_007488 [Nocardia sp. GAS34]|uniref:hypothetical protein n=1 Tax=unclassified Nocardia TaxID=2637762 RepID=UPI003D1E9BC2
MAGEHGVPVLAIRSKPADGTPQPEDHREPPNPEPHDQPLYDPTISYAAVSDSEESLSGNESRAAGSEHG